jgi:NAD(P)H-nitrite reductase large subunit
MKVIAVVGNGIAGSEAAEAARRVDPQAKVVLMTKEPFPLYSACVLADYVANRIPLQQVILKTAKDFEKIGIELLLSRQVMDWSAEERLLHFSDGNLRYDRLVIATGSRPFVPDLPGFGKSGVVALKSLQDAEMLRAAP